MKNSVSVNFKLRSLIIILMIFIAAMSRVFPHMYGFSPLGAIGLFGAAFFVHKWKAFVIPIVATWLSDLFINNVLYGKYYTSFTWFYEGFYWQYAAYFLIVLAGLFIFKKVSPGRVLGGALASSAIFFLVSNLGVWATGTMYPMTLEGLGACYAAGLPFLKGTILGDLFYSTVLFGAFGLVMKYWPQLQLQTVKA